MPITLTQTDYWALLNEMASHQSDSASPDPASEDITSQYPSQLGQGEHRSIQLREGLELTMGRYQLRDDLILHLPDRPHPLEYTLLISGQCRDQHQSVEAGQYLLCSAGMAPLERWEISASQPIIEVNVHIEPELFCQLIGEAKDTSSSIIQQLVEFPEREYQHWSGITPAPLQMVAQQILHCPYQGLIQKLYLESKIWELMALLIEQITQPTPKSNSPTLKAEDIERIHCAKNLLLQRIDRPPSLLELARQVGLNDCTLKRGFRQVFGTTTFGYLHRCRLEQARQILETEDLNIAEVAQRVGFADRSYFTAAFRKQFGCNPSVYRRSQQAQSRQKIPLSPQKNSA
ncbi:MAG: AraC family transcriptional regulator [Elainella sp. Prado103]|jgi:AraC-like DNA-binding protein|nr:AraC family transcriptional regulator [Elainella sp. Prado103]